MYYMNKVMKFPRELLKYRRVILFSLIVLVAAITLVALVYGLRYLIAPLTKKFDIAETASGLKQLGVAPANDASDEVKGVFAERIRSLAKSASTIIIGEDCSLTPDVIALKSGSDLTFKNQDGIEHLLATTQEVKVMAGKETTIKAIFKGAGTYGITCDGSNVVGFIDLSD